MFKKEKLYSFPISREEMIAIDTLRKNGINTSSFLRRQLRKLAKQLILQNQNNALGGILLWTQNYI